MSESTAASWVSATRERAELLHQQIAQLQRLALDAGQPEAARQLCDPLYDELEHLFCEDMPLARAVEESDLLLHLQGPAVEGRRPRVALVSSILGDLRKQVGSMIRVLAAAIDDTLAIPKEIDLGLGSFARGSLVLGFTLPEADAERTFLPGDPFLRASADALSTIGDLAGALEQHPTIQAVEEMLPDPMIRDASLAALARLAPSGQRGIDRVSLAGRALPPGPWRTLTPDIRAQVRTWLEQPQISTEPLTWTGVVREIDLDARRIDLRITVRSEKANKSRSPAAAIRNLRCIYPALYDRQARRWLDQIITVTGRAQLFQGRPRLLMIDEVTPTGSD